AQEEIDRVIGTQRLLVMDDREHLDYVGRLVQKVLRWRPGAPLGVPHACFRDDVYQGCRIPKRAIVFGNVWATSRNTAVYKGPETFEPDRFSDPSVSLSPTFELGRRYVSPLGLFDRFKIEFVHDLSTVRVFTLLARVIAVYLYCLDIGHVQDQNGHGWQGNDIVHYPAPFKLKLTPRSDEHGQLVRAGV
ncbi:hypothetical protein FS749_007430, partial [Ceratobasidium sp. UAMH 11750]